MKQFWLQVIALISVSLIGIFFYSSYNNLQTFSIPSLNSIFNPPTQSGTPVQTTLQKISISDKVTLKIELADTPQKRSLGLGGRDSLATDSGMLFLFDTPPGKHQFWMKGMKIALDFIWINGDQVVDLLPNIPPPTPGTPDNALPIYTSNLDIDKVLEVNAGFINTYNIKVGDKLVLLETK